MANDILKQLPAKWPLSIQDWNGRFHRAMETVDFIYYVNYQESDDNANVKMYRKSDGSLASSNYFASNDMIEVILEKSWTKISRAMKKEALLQIEANG